MKLSIKKKQSKKEFQPFTLEFSIDTIQEARLFFHLCNHGNVMELIKKDTSYGFYWAKRNQVYDTDIASHLVGGGYKDIEEEINRQGYSLLTDTVKTQSKDKLYQRLLCRIQESKAEYINDEEYHTKEDEKAIMNWSDETAKEVYTRLYDNIFKYNEADYMSRTCCFCIKSKMYNDDRLSCWQCEYATNRNGADCSNELSHYTKKILNRCISNYKLRSFIQQAKKDLGIEEGICE